MVTPRSLSGRSGGPAGRSLPGQGQISALDLLGASVPRNYQAAVGNLRLQQPGLPSMIETASPSELQWGRMGIGAENMMVAPRASGEIMNTPAGSLLQTAQGLQVSTGQNPLTQTTRFTPAISTQDFASVQEPAPLAAAPQPVLPPADPNAIPMFTTNEYGAQVLNPAQYGSADYPETAAPIAQPQLPVTQQTRQPEFVSGAGGWVPNYLNPATYTPPGGGYSPAGNPQGGFTTASGFSAYGGTAPGYAGPPAYVAGPEEYPGYNAPSSPFAGAGDDYLQWLLMQG